MCGIAGIINKSSAPFDYSTFCVMGIANDARGGDSCGIFIDGKYEYGTGAQNKFFSNFFVESKLLSEVQEAQIALLHCRKASVGGIGEKQAQPVIITNDKGEVEFVLIHNGTILNYDDLAKKYIPEQSIEGLTDSQVMAKIFYSAGYKVLDEYYGGGVFVMVDYRGKTPKTLLFKGASKVNEYAKEISEERPLYVAIDKASKELVFSSICFQLFACRPWSEIEDLHPNVLYEFRGDKLHAESIYPRKNVAQKMPIVTKTYSYPVYTGAVGDYYNGATYIVGSLEKMKYYLGGKPCHGKLYLSRSGFVSDKKCNSNDEYYFFNGYALKGAKEFKFLIKKQNALGLSFSEFEDRYSAMIYHLGLNKLFNDNGKMMQQVKVDKAVPFTGKTRLINGYTIYVYKDGIQVSSEYTGTNDYEDF